MSAGKISFGKVALWLLLIGVIGLTVYFFATRAKGFERLVTLVRYVEDQKAIERLAKELRDDPKGIDAAIADFSISGGRTRWVSSWMLMTSSLATNVEPKLSTIASSTEQPIDRRLEALRVLWIRTGDASYILQWFELAKPPGGPVVRLGRRHLQNCFELDDIKATLDVEETRPLLQSTEEFEQLVRTPGALVKKVEASEIPLYSN